MAKSCQNEFFWENLSEVALSPCRLKLHLLTKHPRLQHKPLTFLQGKKESFTKRTIAEKEHFRQSWYEKILQTSFESAGMISRTKKLHNLGKEVLMKPYMPKAASVVLEETNIKKLSMIFSLWFCTENTYRWTSKRSWNSTSRKDTRITLLCHLMWWDDWVSQLHLCWSRFLSLISSNEEEILLSTWNTYQNNRWV